MTSYDPYVFIRNDEWFEIGENGIHAKVLMDNGSHQTVKIGGPISSDVIASTVVDLVLAGWEMTEEPK